MVPDSRIRVLREAPPRRGAGFVLYWMTAARRTRWNFGLERAAALAREARLPLLVLEALRCGYRWASDRIHGFIIDGMKDNRKALSSTGVRYYPYLEPKPGAGKGLLSALSARAAAVVTDDFPCFFLPRMLEAARRQVDARFEAVDSNGLLPIRLPERTWPRAHLFRRYLQRTLGPHLAERPRPNPLPGGKLPRFGDSLAKIEKRWPPAGLDADLSTFPIDHAVKPGPLTGGMKAAAGRLSSFLRGRLDDYAELGNHPDEDATSGLSPWLHFGHVGSHEIFDRIARREKWTAKKFGKRTDGGREGAWGMSPAAEAFLDQLVTWRELGFNACALREDYDRYEALPPWALQTLADHAKDRREHVYTLREFEQASTHDRIWNAAQGQLRAEGRLHNYMRMLWGKKILEWSPSPRKALEIMIALNDKYALDGRDPNSYSGILWVLGMYDRPWGPERPVYGKIRYMTTGNAARKLRLKKYVDRYAPA